MKRAGSHLCEHAKSVRFPVAGGIATGSCRQKPHPTCKGRIHFDDLQFDRFRVNDNSFSLDPWAVSTASESQPFRLHQILTPVGSLWLRECSLTPGTLAAESARTLDHKSPKRSIAGCSAGKARSPNCVSASAGTPPARRPPPSRPSPAIALS